MDVAPHTVRLASGSVDPQLQVASAPFSTWLGVIQVRDDAAHLLRSSGDEDRLPFDAGVRLAVEQALVADGAVIEPGSGCWLPVNGLYPVLAHLSVDDAFDVASRMPAPRAEWLQAGESPAPLELRAAILDGVAGWCGAVAR